MIEANSFIKKASNSPGVYQMIGKQGQVLYIGKAKKLKARLRSYFSSTLTPKTKSLMAQVVDIHMTITHSEAEALILECNLIKEHRPRYNVLMRDDKSYPYIIISKHKCYPRIDFYRGRRHSQADFFGPYPNVGAARETLKLLQNMYQLRQCSDYFFKQRTRPCLQYQIGRCSAPCVNKIDQQDYARSVTMAKAFLKGESAVIIDDHIQKMNQAAEKQQYESAAYHRDIINRLRDIQRKQYVAQGHAMADVFAIVREGTDISIALIKIRQGQIIASQCFSPKAPSDMSIEQVFASFLAQYYLAKGQHQDVPKKIIVNVMPADKAWFEQALTDTAKRKILLHLPVRGGAIKWLELVLASAHQGLAQRIHEGVKATEQLEALKIELSLLQLPLRIECFDISHHGGEATQASCVVFENGLPRNAEYRRFNITSTQAGDDYAAMHQVLLRRYLRVSKEHGKLPDLVLIDGGKGQLTQAIKVFGQLGLENISLIAIAKGRSRKSGFEKLYLPGHRQALILSPDSEAFKLLRQIRDEAHRFAITGVRSKQRKQRSTSQLEKIPGIGVQRRRVLLQQFGGYKGLLNATLEEITSVPGIDKTLAKKIFDYLH